MLKVVSGGQTGADQAGWRVARALGIATGGWMPKGFETEDGPRPEFAAEFGAVELEGGYREQTQRNVKDSSATVWFGDPSSPGGRTTLWACQAMGRPVLIVRDGITQPSELAQWIGQVGVEVLNVAGNRESTSPGIGARVERFLLVALKPLVD